MLGSHIFLLLKVVKYVPLANDLEVGNHAALLQIGDRDHADLVYFLHNCLVSYGSLHVRISLVLEKVLVVVDVADLAGDGHAFTVESTHRCVEALGFQSSLADLRIDQVAADHYPSSALAGLAVDSHDIVRCLVEESLHISAEVVDVDKWRRLMVVEFEFLGDSEKVRRVIRPFRAQVIDLVPSRVLELEKGLDIGHMITIDALEPLRWKTHRYDPFRDVAQVQIVAFSLVAVLLERDDPLREIPRLARRPVMIQHLLHLFDFLGRPVYVIVGLLAFRAVIVEIVRLIVKFGASGAPTCEIARSMVQQLDIVLRGHS